MTTNAAPVSELKEVTLKISHNTSSVELQCPECDASNELHATSWPAINTDKIFIISPVASYGTTCPACNNDFVFKPHAE